MKNFPHQYSDIARIRATLETVQELHTGSADVGDDGVLGYELARRGVYTFSGTVSNLEERIAVEQRKPHGNQGPRTAAREGRKTLQYLGWLDAQWNVTPGGHAFLETASGSEGERLAWQQALLDLELVDDGQISHPIRLLLRLVRDNEIVARDGLELALEALDDSDDEYRRVSGLLQLPRAERLQRIGVGPAKAADAVKILPRFAEQADFIRRASVRAPYYLTDVGTAALDEDMTAGAVELRPAVRSNRRRRVRGRPRRLQAGGVVPPAAGDPEGWASLSHEEQIAATRLRFERTTRHQNLVAELLARLERGVVHLYEDGSSYDLLHVPAAPEPITIFEVKTLEADELTQTRLAVGQLLSYEYLNVRPEWEGREIRRALVYERAVDEELAGFLDAVDIAAFVLADGELAPLNDHARRTELG